MAEPPPDTLEWHAEPWRRMPGSVTVVAMGFGLLLIYALVFVRDGLMGVLVMLAALYVMAPLLVPVRYRLDAEGLERATRFSRRRWRWREFADYRVDPNGRAVFLRHGGRGLARWRSGPALFVPDAVTLDDVVRRVEAGLAAARSENGHGGSTAG